MQWDLTAGNEGNREKILRKFCDPPKIVANCIADKKGKREPGPIFIRRIKKRCRCYNENARV